MNRQQAIDKARLRVDRGYSPKTGQRKWLVGIPPDSYGTEDYRSELHVLEGSPPKGYVLVLGHDHYGSVTGLHCGEKVVCRYWWGRENALLPRDYTARLPGAKYGRRLPRVKES